MKVGSVTICSTQTEKQSFKKLPDNLLETLKALVENKIENKLSRKKISRWTHFRKSIKKNL